MALQGFKDGVCRVLVATDVAARGIHVDDIAHVDELRFAARGGVFHSCAWDAQAGRARVALRGLL